jgi:hypothetical protein
LSGAPPDPASGGATMPLSRAQEVRRQKVLAMLSRDGGQYAILVEDPNTDPVVMALATSDGTCELRIGKGRYDAFAIAAMVVRWNPEHHVPRSAA